MGTGTVGHYQSDPRYLSPWFTLVHSSFLKGNIMDKKLISIVVPMYYEEQVALEFYKRLTKAVSGKSFDYEILFVNDGSKDKTEQILKELAEKDKKVKVINFARNFGHQVAVTAGIYNALGDAVVLIDADLQDPPELIPEFVEKWQKGYQVVYAKRLKRKGESFFKKVSAKYFYKVLNFLSDTDIPKDTGDFRLMDRCVVEVFKLMPEKHKFIRGMVSWIGFDQTFIEYERDERFAGETKYPLKKMLKFALDGILSFSTKPLKLVTEIGLLTVVMSFFVLLFALYMKFSGQSELGWTSIMVVVTFFSGVQLLSIGILGEYIGRIYDETRNRPAFIVKSKLNIDGEK